MNKNKGRRFLRKALRFRMLFLYLIIIAILVLVGCYTIGGLKASSLDPNADNVKFSYEGFTNQGTETYEDGTDYNKKISENSEYELWFDSSTTIVTVKEKSTGITYSTAQKETNATGAALVVEYSNSSTGKLSNVAYDSMQYSVQYKNPMTESYERHYFTKNVDNGVQVIYEIGEFNAGIDYLPEYYLATLYKPVKEAFTDKDGNIEEERYNTAYENWINYMKHLGCQNPEDASYSEIVKYLSTTFEEQFRGNIEPTIKSSYDTGKWNYTGTVKIYTKEAYEYFKDLVESGKVATTGKESFDDEPSLEKNTNNPYWKVTGVDPTVFTDYVGVYFNTEDSPLRINPFMQGESWKFLKETAYKLISQTDDDFKFMYYKRQSIKSATLVTAYNLLYKTKQYEFVGQKYWNNDGTPNMVGGIPARDNDGNYIYENGELKCEFYTLEKASEYNAMFGIETSSSLPVFQIGVQYLLTENGLEVTIMGNSVCDASNAKNSELVLDDVGNKLANLNSSYLLYDTYVLPYFTYVDNSKLAAADQETGTIVVPDGSGATINFNNGKYEMGASAVNASYYGADASFTSKQITEDTEDLMLGMYGVIYTTASKCRSVLGIVAKGGNQVSLYANTTNGANSAVAQAYFIATLRSNEVVKIGAYSSKNIFTKWASRLNTTDFEFVYAFKSYASAEEANYTAIAKQYRSYLVKSQGLTDKDSTTNTVVDLNFLGAFEKYALMLGFKYKTPDSLTTFKQAQEIVEELTTGIEIDGTNKKINSASVSYTAWTNEELEYQVGGNMSVSSCLGGKSGLQKFVNYLDNKGISFYSEEYITTTKGYDLAFGSAKYTARSVANNPSRVYQFDVATQRQNKKVSSTYVINPVYYNDIALRVNKATAKLKLTAKASSDTKTGYYLVDLGNMSSGSYKKGNVVYGQEAIAYQQEALSTIAQNYLVKIKAPYDYAFKYADVITDVPLTSTARQIYDSTIPLYQLVISGLVDYTTEAINGTSSKSHYWFLSKAIETGSNLSFLLSAENPTVLLDTDYTYYYQSYYQNWKEFIVEMASEIDSIGIMAGTLVEHKTIGKNIAYVKYEISAGNYIELYVNTTGSDYTYNTTTIPAYGYVKIN